MPSPCEESVTCTALTTATLFTILSSDRQPIGDKLNKIHSRKKNISQRSSTHSRPRSMSLSIVDVLRQKENRGRWSTEGKEGNRAHRALPSVWGIYKNIYGVNIYGYVHVFRVWSRTWDTCHPLHFWEEGLGELSWAQRGREGGMCVILHGFWVFYLVHARPTQKNQIKTKNIFKVHITRWFFFSFLRFFFLFLTLFFMPVPTPLPQGLWQSSPDLFPLLPRKADLKTQENFFKLKIKDFHLVTPVEGKTKTWAGPFTISWGRGTQRPGHFETQESTRSYRWRQIGDQGLG